MNKFYFIVPGALLLGFLFVYNGAMKEMTEKENRKQAEIAAIKAEDDRRRADLDRKATEDAQRRQAEREAEEKAKADKREKDYTDAMTLLKNEADKYASEADAAAAEAAKLEIELANLRTQREKTNREAFELSKQVETAKIARRTAELEIQRMVDMVAQRIGASSFAAMPPPPPPAKK